MDWMDGWQKDMQSTEGVFYSRYSFFSAVNCFPSTPVISLHDYNIKMLNKTHSLQQDYKTEVLLLDFTV